MERQQIVEKFKKESKGNLELTKYENHLIDWLADLYEKMKLPDSKRNLLVLWEARKLEIEDTGKCKNKHGTDFFSPKYTKQEMLNYCDKMIAKILEDV